MGVKRTKRRARKGSGPLNVSTRAVEANLEDYRKRYVAGENVALLEAVDTDEACRMDHGGGTFLAFSRRGGLAARYRRASFDRGAAGASTHARGGAMTEPKRLRRRRSAGTVARGTSGRADRDVGA
jgi:hypothetical protein